MKLDISPRRGAWGPAWGRRERPPLRTVSAVGTALVLGAALFALTSPAQGLNNARTGALDDRGFPESYTDDAGLTLDLCEDGSANCLAAVEGDLVAPDGEALYWAATATLPTRRGELAVEFALEAAFDETGAPQVFDRLRVRGHLTRAGRYTLRHPYGTTRITVESPAEQRNVNFTEDLLCNLGPRGACGGHIDSWLRSTRAPRGYLGAGELATRVTGGTARNRLMFRAPNGRVIGRTRLFAVLGKLAPGPQAALSSTSVDFGNTRDPRRRSVVVRNIGNAPLRFDSIRLRGNRSIRLARTGCVARTNAVASGGRCRVNLTYRPTVRRGAARLVIDDNSHANVHRLDVDGRSTSVVATRRRLHFTARRVGTESGTRRVVVENTGARKLRIRGISFTGGNQRSFGRRTGAGPRCGRGTSLAPGRACAVYVAFAPRSFGLKHTNLRIRSNALSNPDLVRLNGRGR